MMDSEYFGQFLNCPKYSEFYSKNKFEKLVHLVGFIITIYYFRCYTVHVDKSLNYFTNHCTYINL